MSELNKTPELTPNDVALAAGKQVIAAGVELVATTIAETEDPTVRESLENELREKLIESGLPVVIPNQDEINPDNIHLRRGIKTNRSRVQVLMDSKKFYGDKSRPKHPRIK